MESNGKVSWKYQSCYHSITLSLSSREFPALISAYRRSRCAMLVEDLERSYFATCCQLERYNFEAFQVLHCESRPGTPGNHIVQKVTAQESPKHKTQAGCSRHNVHSVGNDSAHHTQPSGNDSTHHHTQPSGAAQDWSFTTGMAENEK